MTDSQIQIFMARLSEKLYVQGDAYGISINPSQTRTIQAVKDAVQAKFPLLRTVAPDQIYILKLEYPVTARRRRSP